MSETAVHTARDSYAADDRDRVGDFDETRLARLRPELMAYCYAMLGSLHDAEDVVQEVLIRAWRARQTYDPGIASVRTWVYRIATNACRSAVAGRRRRALPAGLSAAAADLSAELSRAEADPWLQPIPDRLVVTNDDDPALIVARRESVRLALVAALQGLPARQRAVFLLREVLELPASEVASQLGMSVAAVKSALQRARAQLPPSPDTFGQDPDDFRVVGRYVTAFETGDVELLTAVLREDITLQMPPIRAWFAGRGAVTAFVASHLIPASGLWRLTPVNTNGALGVATYARNSGRYLAHSIQVLELADGQIRSIVAFQDARLFAEYALPLEWHDDLAPLAKEWVSADPTT